MGSDLTQADKTSADDTSVGYTYQYYYFLCKLLQLKVGQSVGLEVRDDVHTDLGCDQQILIQTKHTVKKKADGSPSNLTTYDHALWKTLSNWAKVISDEKAKRADTKSQLAFISRTEFMLVTNKSASKDCKFLVVVADTTNARNQLEVLKAGTIDSEVIAHISDVLALEDLVLERFLKKIVIETEVNNIIDDCKNALRAMHLPESKIEDTFALINSKISEDNFVLIRSGEKVEVSFDEFHRKYRAYFDRARSGDLTIRREYIAFSEKLTEQCFIQQLIDISDVDPLDEEYMAKLTRFRLLVENNIARWLLDGDLTPEEEVQFNEDAKLFWENIFRPKYRGWNPTINPVPLALSVLDEIRMRQLLLAKQPMDIDFSNGAFYRLSNTPEIGWLPDWKEKYK